MNAIRIILIFLLPLISCQKTRYKDNPKLITYKLKKLPKTSEVRLSDLNAINIKYIPLETNEQCLITGINDLLSGNRIIAGGRFFLTKYWNTILEFKYDGSFVNRIGTVGRGPNEITTVYDVNIDKRNQSIYFLCDRGRKLNIYSEKGEFVKSFQIPFYSNEFTFTKNSILCYSENHFGNVENSYALIDTNALIIQKYPNKYPFKKHDGYFIWHENLFYRFNSRVFKKEVYSDTIYVFEDMRFKPHLVIEVGEKLMTPAARSEFDGQYLLKNYVDPLNLFEFGNYIYYEFIYRYVIPDDVLILGFIGSKKDNFRALFNTGQGIINDLDGGPNILPKTIKDENTIIGWIDALKLKAHVASDVFKNSSPKYPEKKKELEKLANSLKETDNPVLILVSLKKD